jgi:hypothetical protein
MLTPVDQERLLDVAQALEARLRAVAVSFVSGGPAGLGVPRSVLGTVVAYLKRVRDVDALQRFVALLDQLDSLAAQNQLNPKAHYAALRRELEHTLPQHAFSADEWLFVLAWTARLLPREGSPEEKPDRPAGTTNRATSVALRPQREQISQRRETGGFNTLQLSFDKARKSGSSSSSPSRSRR